MIWKKKISLAKLLALLVCVVGVAQVFAQCKTKQDSTRIDSKDYCVIRNAAGLVWFSDTVNNYVISKKWDAMIKKIQEDEQTDEFKANAISLMEAIRQNPELYSRDPDKKALWNTAPYVGYLTAAYDEKVSVPFNAIIDADYIDMKNHPFTPITMGDGNSGGTGFAGTFDGNGVAIQNLSIDSTQIQMQFYDVIKGYVTGRQNIGMFGIVKSGGVVKNLILDNVDVKATGKNAFWTNSIKQVSVGAITGWLCGGKIETSFASGSISSDGYDVGAGGIAGAVKGGNITDCLSDVDIFASGSHDVYVGGIIGVARDKPTVSNCVYDGNSLVANPDGDGLGAHGAIVGKAADKSTITFQNCLFDSDIVGKGIGYEEGTPTVNGSAQGVPVVNIAQNSCLLNLGTWSDGSCKNAKSSIWTNSVNITNNGVTKDTLGNMVYVVTFDANGGLFAEGAKITKTFLVGKVLTGLGVVSPTREGRSFGGWALTADADAAAADLGRVYKPKTVYAYWKKNFDITFNANGGAFGDGSETKVKTIVEGESIVFTGENPSDYSTGSGENRKDYKFMGWALKKNASETEDLGIASSNTTVFAVWKETQVVYHTVVFNKGLGKESSSVRVERGTLLNESAFNLSAVGYRFDGWYNEAEGNTKFDFNQPVTADDILYAKWTLVDYSIVYNLDGGVNGANPIKYNIESPLISLEPPTKVGFDFVGWFVDDAYNIPVDAIEPGQTGDKTFFAKWNEIIYLIEFKASATKVPSKGIHDPLQKRYNESVLLYGQSFIAPGYEQDGWSIEDGDENTPTTYDLNQEYTVNASVLLYPHWKKATYKITYHNVEEAVNTNPATYQMDTVNALALSKPSREGYKFDGWFYDELYTDQLKNEKIETEKFGDLDLYAKWTPIKVTVEVKANTCVYDGNYCGPTVTASGYSKDVYKIEVVTDSIRNVFDGVDGSIEAKVVSLVIKNKTTDKVITGFDVVYKDGKNSALVTVNPKTISFTGRDTSADYTGDEIHVSSIATVDEVGGKPGLVEGHTHNVGYDITAIDVGTYKPSMTAKEDVKIYDAAGNDVTANYTVSEIKGPSNGLEIKKLVGSTFVVTLADEFVKDDGSLHAMTNRPTSDAKSGKTTYEYWYGTGSPTSDLSSLKWNSEGEYEIHVRATNPNYDQNPETTAKFTITAKPIISFTANSKSKDYDGTALTDVGYVFSGVLEPGDELGDIVVEGSITNAGVDFNTIKSVEIIRGGTNIAESGVYAINTVAGILTVNKVPLVITALDKTEIYDGTEHKNVATVEGLKNGEKLTVSASQTVVGSTNAYAYEWGSTNPLNYEITENLGTLTVTPKSVTITVANASKLYGENDPDFSKGSTIDGLVNADDLDPITYYRENSAEKNAGKYTGVITASYTANPNYTVSVVPADFTINKRSVTLTSAADTKAYDGTPLTAPVVKVEGDGFAPDEGFIFKVTGSQTDVGFSENAFTYTVKSGTDLDRNYTVADPVYGTLTVTASPVTVSINGHSNSYVYSGSEQKVYGYDVSIDNSLYKESYFSFNKSESADSIAKGTNVGSYKMNLAKSLFVNENANFDVTFNVVSDGELEITPKSISVKVGITSKIYGYPITDSDYKAATYATGFSENDPIEDLLKKCTYSRTPAGNDVGIYSVSANCPDYGNYKVTNEPNANNFKITKRTLALTATAEKTYGDKDPTSCSAKLSGFVDADAATVKECKFDSRLATDEGEDVGNHLFTASASKLEWSSTTDKNNYSVEPGSGTLTIKPSPVTVAITGHTNSTVYSGAEQKVHGYDVSFVNSLYKESYFSFNNSETADSIAKDKNVGSYKMNLTKDLFVNENANFDVTFTVVSDGELTITPKPVDVAMESTSKIYGDTDPDFKKFVSLTGWVKGESTDGLFETGKCEIERTKGESVGTYTVSVKNCPATYANYTINVTPSAMGNFSIDKRPLVLTATAEKFYGDKDPTSCSAIISGFLTGDTATAKACSITKRITKGESVGSYQFTASVSDSDIEWGSTTDKNNYSVGAGTGYLTIKSKENVGNTVVAIWHIDAAGNPVDSIVVPISKSDMKNDQITRTVIRNAINEQNITPTKEENADSTYTFNKNWMKLETGRFVAGFRGDAKQTEIVVKYDKKDTIHVVVDVPRTRVDALVTEDINEELENRGISVTKASNNDSTYVIDAWKKNSAGVYEPEFKGVAIMQSILVIYGENNDEFAEVYVALAALRDEELTNKAINHCLDSLEIVPNKSGNGTDDYYFTGKWKNIGDNEYEALFEHYDPSKEVKTVVAKYGDNPSDTIVFDIYEKATDENIIKAISDTLEARNITPTKADDGEYGYTFDGTWSKNATTKQYEPGFVKSKIMRIVVKYGEGEKDTVQMKINELDSDSIVKKKIEDVLNESKTASVPTKEGDSTHVYELKKFVLNETTNVYEPVFEKKGRLFNVDFHLPSEGRLLSKFSGYRFGEETLLPGAFIVGDTAWKFKGWYQKPNGLGNRYKAMRSTDYGDKDVYPLFQKTIRYETREGKGSIEVVYTSNALRDVVRALEGVIPGDYTKNNVTYTFAGWSEENGVYKAKMADITSVKGPTSVPLFNVAVNGRALEVSGAKLGARLMVFDMNGVLVSRGVVSHGTQRVELSSSGMYIVRVNNQLRRVKVK